MWTEKQIREAMFGVGFDEKDTDDLMAFLYVNDSDRDKKFPTKSDAIDSEQHKIIDDIHSH